MSNIFKKLAFRDYNKKLNPKLLPQHSIKPHSYFGIKLTPESIVDLLIENENKYLISSQGQKYFFVKSSIFDTFRLDFRAVINTKNRSYYCIAYAFDDKYYYINIYNEDFSVKLKKGKVKINAVTFAQNLIYTQNKITL